MTENWNGAGQQNPTTPQPGYAAAGAPIMRPSMGMGQAVKAFFQNYARFDGRAGRSEYWWTALALGLTSMVLSILINVLGISVSSNGQVALNGFGILLVIVMVVFYLAIIVPALALTARRLHDANFSALLILVGLIPGASLVVTILCIIGSNPQGARFDGPVQPKLGL